jgi:hypothetical protein
MLSTLTIVKSTTLRFSAVEALFYLPTTIAIYAAQGVRPVRIVVVVEGD